MSSSEGDDHNTGVTKQAPWASLKRVSRADLLPGDIVRFKSGDTFAGMLRINQSGSGTKPIVFTSYGDGNNPIIDGALGVGGDPIAAIFIRDQDHIEISNLTIRNFRKRSRKGVSDYDSFGIYVKNTGKRILRGFNFHHLKVEDIFPVLGRNKFNREAFNNTDVTGIRFETEPPFSLKKVANTRDIFVHSNLIRRTARFGVVVRHRASKLGTIRNSLANYDVNFIVLNNRCEDLGGSCVLMHGVFRGLLQGNTFVRSGAMVEPELSVNRGSGAWFFRSKNIVAQQNTAAFSRGRMDSAGIHVDFGNENVLVQYNFSYDNEGYGTEILGNNKNIIWRFNISVGDGTRQTGVSRPEGGKSQHPGRTLHVTDYSRPRRLQSDGVYIYNNTYVITPNSSPDIELNGKNIHIWNNLFVVEKNAHLGRNTNIVWSKDDPVDFRGNVFSGSISQKFLGLDSGAKQANINFDGDQKNGESYAISAEQVNRLASDQPVIQPAFPAAGKGIFAHISEKAEIDFFGNKIIHLPGFVGAGYKNLSER